ncbi:hypothetical protein GIB67_006551 [Kingdonia uniflora]|uniref:Uncharacterized protein n=1 Tax=Kingdonia uniflora TaxID=39325 RepID=A0A7J7LEL9_9MAGN|nr:hypothetical protein GIB67_006551 [Kingdonia uniflora]
MLNNLQNPRVKREIVEPELKEEDQSAIAENTLGIDTASDDIFCVKASAEMGSMSIEKPVNVKVELENLNKSSDPPGQVVYPKI